MRIDRTIASVSGIGFVLIVTSVYSVAISLVTFMRAQSKPIEMQDSTAPSLAEGLEIAPVQLTPTTKAGPQRDPFTGRVTGLSETTAIVPKLPDAVPRTQAVPRNRSIVVHAIITGSSASDATALVSIDGVSHTVRIGDRVRGVRIIGVDSKGVTVSYGGKRKVTIPVIKTNRNRRRG